MKSCFQWQFWAHLAGCCWWSTYSWRCWLALRRGIAGCYVQNGRSDIVVVPAGHLAVCGRADGMDVVVDRMKWRTIWKSAGYAGELVVSVPLDAVRRHLPVYDSLWKLSLLNFVPFGAGSSLCPNVMAYRQGSSSWALSGQLPGRLLARFHCRSLMKRRPVRSTHYCVAALLVRLGCSDVWKWDGCQTSFLSLLASIRAALLDRPASIVDASGARVDQTWYVLLYAWPLILSVCCCWLFFSIWHNW